MGDIQRLLMNETKRLERCPFPIPVGWDSPEFTCTDLRDASLALRAEHVIGNDVSADGKALVIITGANSGGKSTFLRSVGLAQLMTQSGMFVTAGSVRVSVCQQLFTHFIREEDPSGRLDEELSRMSTIADPTTTHRFLVRKEFDDTRIGAPSGCIAAC